jgi:type II restriction/modification system DNA methylase subunit YeeA
MDIVRRPSDNWIVDFGVAMNVGEAAHFELPFEYVREHVKDLRDNVRREGHRRYWWRHAEPRPGMRKALKPLRRFLVTPRVAKHRIFVALNKLVVPDTRLVVIARDDETTFGVLLSKFHEAWSLKTCSWHGVGNDPTYNAVSCFETFPFPEGLTPDVPALSYANDPRATVIAKATNRLDELRNAWLNPPDLVDIVPETVPGYPDRILPKNAEAAAFLKKRTLTNLYNERPQWLADAHRDLDAAVANAYGWPTDISEEDALAKLLELNLSRAGMPCQSSGSEGSIAED